MTSRGDGLVFLVTVIALLFFMGLPDEAFAQAWSVAPRVHLGGTRDGTVVAVDVRAGAGGSVKG